MISLIILLILVPFLARGLLLVLDKLGNKAGIEGVPSKDWTPGADSAVWFFLLFLLLILTKCDAK